MTKQTEAMKLALEKIADALPAYIDGVASRDYLATIHKALAEQPAQQEPVRPCTHPSLGACSLREDGTASRWNCVMCGTEFVPKATQRWAEFNETTKRNIEHAKWYLSTHPQPAQRKPLTDEEIGRMYASCKYGSVLELAKAIEAAHGIKENT